MDEAKERVEARNVSLYPSDWQIIDGQDKYGFGTSATLRMIIRQWQEMQARVLTDQNISQPYAY